MEENHKIEILKKSESRKQQQQQPSQHQKVSESVLRVSFLEQAAALLSNNNGTAGPSSSTSSSSCTTANAQTMPNPAAGANTSNLLSRLLLRELRECAFVDQLRMHRDFKRSHCKRCFQNWLPINDNDTAQIEVRARPGAIMRICKNCGAKRRFSTKNPNYRSRNEKTGHFE